MVKIRLKRAGRTGYPVYNVVVAHSKCPRDGKFVEKLCTYNPFTKQLTGKSHKLNQWFQNGAQPTNTVVKLIKKHLDPTLYSSYVPKESYKSFSIPKGLNIGSIVTKAITGPSEEGRTNFTINVYEHLSDPKFKRFMDVVKKNNGNGTVFEMNLILKHVKITMNEEKYKQHIKNNKYLKNIKVIDPSIGLSEFLCKNKIDKLYFDISESKE